MKATDRSSPLQGARHGSASGGEQEALPPLLRVVRGEPTAEELAALTVVVAAMSQRRARRRPTPVGAWAAFGRTHRRPLPAGPGGWRAAGGPA